MSSNSGPGNKTLGIIFYCTILILIVWGGICVAFEVRPFWIDEWRIIYNLKFKSPEEIWGQLAYMQQFPRVYLYLLQAFTSCFEYCYQSLRFIPWVVGVGAIACIHLVATRLYGRGNPYRFLMVMMLVSSGTFTTYFVEVKQYTMELLLSAAAVWQLHYLLQMDIRGKNIARYALFCITMLAAPFFSYTYALVILPAYAIVLLHNIATWNNSDDTKGKIRHILMQWAPLFLCTFSITLFYIIDARNLSADSDMKEYWNHLLNTNGFQLFNFIERLFHFFAQTGSGFLFWWLFGLLCSGAFIMAIYQLIMGIKKKEFSMPTYVLAYSVLLVLFIVGLNLANKLPMGEPRLNAFAIPALSILLINLLQHIRGNIGKMPVPRLIFLVLLAGLMGNIYTTIAAVFTDDKYARRMDIYHATQKAVRTATEQQLPILISPEVAWPYDKTQNFPFEGDVPGDWVLMTWPAYKPQISPQVFAIPDTLHIAEWMQQLPDGITSVMAGDGLNYRVVRANP